MNIRSIAKESAAHSKRKRGAAQKRPFRAPFSIEQSVAILRRDVKPWFDVKLRVSKSTVKVFGPHMSTHAGDASEKPCLWHLREISNRHSRGNGGIK